MEEKVVKIEIPEGYEIDKEKSSFDKIIFKKKVQQVLTWEDLIGKDIPESSKYIDTDSLILEMCGKFHRYTDENTFIDEKHAKSALAMAKISQLMPYYGDAITDEEWKYSTRKYVISKYKNTIKDDYAVNLHYFLAFHTKEQRDSFYRNNEQLVKDYLMLD